MNARVKNTNKDHRGKKRVQTVNNDPSMTVQSDAHLADINNIMARFRDEGLQKLDQAALVYADVSDFGDYTDVMLEVKRAEEMFLKLPSKVRELFGHSVETFLDTAHDEDKRAAMIEAGVLEGPVEVVPEVVPEVIVEEVSEG